SSPTVVPFSDSAAPAAGTGATAKPKKPVSAAKYAACLAASKHSTGPRDTTVTSRNALKLGMTCESITFLPGESEEAFYAHVERWGRELGADGEAQWASVEMACFQQLKSMRIRNAAGAAGNEKIAHINDEFDDRSVSAARALLPELSADPNRIVMQLRSSTSGCELLLEKWSLIEDRLRTHLAIEVSQRRTLIELNGRRPGELFSDPLVYEIDRLFLGAIHGQGGCTAAMAAETFFFDRDEMMSPTEFERRLTAMVNNLPPVEEAHDRLVNMVSGAM